MQGARRVTDDEVELMIADNRVGYAKMENPHENLYGVHLKAHPRGANIADTNGKAMDIPTKEAFYRNVGWTRDDAPAVRDFG